MATRSASVTTLKGGTVRVTWTGLLNGDDGSPVDYPEYADRTVQVLGTFGAGGTLLVEGSLEETAANYGTLTDPQGNALSVTAAKLETVMEMSGWIRPRVSAGDGTTDLTVHMLMRRR